MLSNNDFQPMEQELCLACMPCGENPGATRAVWCLLVLCRIDDTFGVDAITMLKDHLSRMHLQISPGFIAALTKENIDVVWLRHRST